MKRQLWFWVLVAIAAGIAFGLVAPGPATDSKWLADAFLQLIKTVTAPVIFVTVVIGIASLGDMARAGGLALRALGYFLGATVLALALGLVAGNLIQPGLGLRGRRDRVRHRGGEGEDRRGRGLRDRVHRLHHRRPAADVVPAAVRGERDPARARDRDPGRRGRLGAGEASARAGHLGLRDGLQGPLRDHPDDHVGRAAGRVRRHGVHGRPVRRRRALEPRAADGHLLGHVRGVRVRHPRAGRALERLQHLQVRAAAEGRAADHRRHVLL